jgi:molybdopterin synthase sulfur carrier subunit
VPFGVRCAFVRIRVRLFAALREAAGRGEFELDLPPAATPEDAWGRLAHEHPALASRRGSLAASVNRRYAPFSQTLAEGDELVFIPPVSGG